MTYVCLETRNSVDLQANSVAGTCNEPKEQELHGASEVSDEQDKPPPNKWKQRIKTTQAIIGPGFVVGVYEYIDKVGNHVINNFHWEKKSSNVTRTLPQLLPISTLEAFKPILMWVEEVILYTLWSLCLPGVLPHGKELN